MRELRLWPFLFYLSLVAPPGSCNDPATGLVLPAPCVQAATLTFSCSGGLGLAGSFNDFRLRFFQGPSSATHCGLSQCDPDRILINAVIRCSQFVGDPTATCDDIVETLVADLGSSIDAQSDGLFQWEPAGKGGMTISSATEFHICLCGFEFSSALLARCQSNMGYPLSFCAVYNLCDGLADNQTDDPQDWKSGLGIVLEESTCPVRIGSLDPKTLLRLLRDLLDGAASTEDLFRGSLTWFNPAR